MTNDEYKRIYKPSHHIEKVWYNIPKKVYHNEAERDRHIQCYNVYRSDHLYVYTNLFHMDSLGRIYEDIKDISCD